MSTAPIDVIQPHPTLAQKTVAFYTLGCKTNQLESATLAQQFTGEGWQVVPFDHSAQVYVINSCTVTQRSDNETQRVIRRAKLANPSAQIAVTGCYAQVAPEEVAAQPGVTHVVGNDLKGQLTKLVLANTVNLVEEEPVAPPHVWVQDIDKSRMVEGATQGGIDRTRASLKIQDGCDFQCTYCIIWEARGKSRSLPVADLLLSLQRLVDEGFTEVVLTGINIGQYQCPTTEANLATLLREMLALQGTFRLRLSSLDPYEVTPELIAVLKECARFGATEGSSICPHIHLSAQSGEDFVLKRMGRRHHAVDVARVCEELTQAVPNMAIGSDIIVGFPGETAERFEATAALLASIPMHYYHVFSYSKRKGTPAAGFPDQVPEREKKARANRLKAQSDAAWLAYRESFINYPLTMVVETDGRKGVTENYIHVALPEGSSAEAGRLLSVQINRVETMTTIVEAI
ncbi:MAG: tRNA (N(6)-L-threonylcarbamoyladenosine(37)-C(2))-methylthiotransferase MtaB [Vampirovibrionales bacterium]|nr:tRNA (N(6)-L-threonylcarbamoyladenosine(37)-C(2))-methylthiotransferase MtaB [Vampirovibrionales bacterium]